jgi:ADP-heptose:LPS heptosyltransferase
VAVGRRLLVLRALGLGDLLTAVPALRALADAFPDHRRLLAMPAGLGPLAGLIAGDDGRPSFEPVTAEPLGALPPVARAADIAVNLHGRGPQSHGVLRAAGVRSMIAFAHPEVPEHQGPVWRAREHEVRRWCRLLTESAIAADPARLRIARPPPATGPDVAGATLLHAGAASAARRWPADRWVAVARAETARGRAVVLTGAAGERPRALGIARAAGLPDSAVLAGRTGLLELAGLVAGVARVVCNDTGVAHLATALGTPSVVLFGPSSPAIWGPPPLARHRALWAGRTGDPHAARCDPGLRAISVARVIAEMRALDAATPRR